MGILIVVLVIAVIWAVSTVNGFKRKEIKIQESLSGIEVALTKRCDLLTKLLDTTKGYMQHEKEVYSEVIRLRKGMSVGDMNEAEAQMSAMTGRLFAVAESYPELKSAAVFRELQNGISDAEEHLQAARRAYNANVAAYNTAIAMFPGSLLAGGRTAKEFFEAESHKREDVKMTF